MFNESIWSGNIWEFRNVIEKWVILSKDKLLKVPPLEKIAIPTDEKLLPLTQLEKEHILKVLTITNWRISGPKGVAKILKPHPKTLRSKRKKFNNNKSQN